MKLLAFTFLFLPFVLIAQTRQMLSIELRKTIKEMPADAELDLYLRGDIASLSDFVRTENGRIKGVLNNILSCRLPVSKIEMLNSLEGLEYIEFSSSKPHVLNDVMVFNNNINPIHMGSAPLPQAYLGDDVILGIIDTGIELAHPDFQNADGTTRVIALWDQNQDEIIPYRVPEPYGYGQEWNAEDINANITGHQDQANQYGHGSNVAGVAAGNGSAIGKYAGVAPKADIIVVSSDLDRENWAASAAEAMDFIFAKAEAVGKPAVINLSLGDYYGSHDGLDASTLFVDALLDELPGRAVVAAAGNSGNLGNYHLSYNIPEADTAFTWFKYNNTAQAVFFELWTDTADFQTTKYSIGADLSVPNYSFKGYAGWRNAQENLNTLISDTIFHQGTILGIVETWVGLRGGQYLIQVQVTQPFSNQYLWRFATTGGGKFDCWSHGPFGTSAMVETNLPNIGSYPAMVNYKLPDNQKTVVDGWVCSDKVIAVGNYANRNSFVNFLGEITSFDVTPGEISINCSRGPTRDMRQKPDIAASGDHTLTTGKISILNSWVNIHPEKVAQGGMHYVNGGTSMASPVVAGVAALYFSRDHEANYLDVKNAIIENALADIQTGTLPGNQFGYGKLDAFAALTVPFLNPSGIHDFNEKNIPIYPNPTTGVIRFQSENKDLNAVNVFDIAGRLILHKKPDAISGNEYSLDVSQLQNGVYVVSFESDNGIPAIAKLILEK